MPRKADNRPKLTDAERHKRFKEMARQVGASDKPEDFEKAFKKVVGKKPKDQSPKKG
jgi:hypothetical protein